MKALSLDFYGTLVHTRRPVGASWAEVAARHGIPRDPVALDAAFRTSFRATVARGGVQHGDGRPFWREVVAGVFERVDPVLSDALYDHFADPAAWRVADHARDVLRALAQRGWRIGVLSNSDERVRTLVRGLGIEVDAVILSGEAGADKPDPRPFWLVCERLGVAPHALTHLGDDPIADGDGARGAGARALIWGIDVKGFSELRSALHER